VGKAVRIVILLIVLLLGLASSEASAASNNVYVLRAKGTITPVLAGYIDRGLGQCEAEGAAACVIQLDTPGGLDGPMRDIVQRILNAKVPVIVYVSPAGARAASAGTFITMAGHIAAMAPNTAIGAAHPVFLGSSGEPQETEKTLEEKATNDAVAYIKSIATERKRNADWAESAVRESVSANEKDALALNVIDVVAPDLPSLLAQLDGREVSLLSGPTTLQLKEANIVYVNMNPIESFLFTISDPNIAYILLSLAMTGIFLELSNPGAILPGVVGGLCLLLGLYSLGTLPVNWAGVLLIGFAFVLFVAEVFVTSHGLLALGGVASLALGSLILTAGNPPFLAIDPRLIGGVVAIITILFAIVIRAVVRTQRQRPVTGREALIGKMATVRTPLKPMGTVFLQGEIWRAKSEEGEVESGEEVIINRVEGLELWVTKNK